MLVDASNAVWPFHPHNISCLPEHQSLRSVVFGILLSVCALTLGTMAGHAAQNSVWDLLCMFGLRGCVPSELGNIPNTVDRNRICDGGRPVKSLLATLLPRRAQEWLDQNSGLSRWRGKFTTYFVLAPLRHN